jgi:hypothetical protein
MDKGQIDLDAYVELVRLPRASLMLKGLTERNQVRQLIGFLQEHPQLMAMIQAQKELFDQAEALGIPLTEDQELEEEDEM